MTRKYDMIDDRLLEWLRTQPERVTTAEAIRALAITDSTTQRHISRRFTLLEHKGAIVCQLRGTTRICSVQPELLPKALHKGGPNNRTWRNQIRKAIDDIIDRGPQTPPPSSHPSIPASNSAEFETAGGVVQRLSSIWDTGTPPCPRLLGPSTPMERILNED